MLIILDLDGTLIDSEKCHYNSFVKSFKRNGFNLNKSDKDKIKSVFGMSSKDIIKSVIPSISNEKLISISNDVKTIAVNEEIVNVKFINGSMDFLKDNFKKHSLAIATNSSKIFTNAVLKKFNLKKYFKIIVTPSDVKESKPSPEMLNLVVKKTGFKKKDCVMIGDSIFDYKSANSTKIKFIGVLSKSDYVKELKKVSEYFNDLSEVKL